MLWSSGTASISQSKHTPKVSHTSAISMDFLTNFRLFRELRDSHEATDGFRNFVSATYLDININLQKRLLHEAPYGSRHANLFFKVVNKAYGGLITVWNIIGHDMQVQNHRKRIMKFCALLYLWSQHQSFFCVYAMLFEPHFLGSQLQSFVLICLVWIKLLIYCPCT